MTGRSAIGALALLLTIPVMLVGFAQIGVLQISLAGLTDGLDGWLGGGGVFALLFMISGIGLSIIVVVGMLAGALKLFGR
jgi:hypothetical protein